MNLEIRHLQMIIAITDEKGVTNAAKKLFITQSALSHQLKDIENRLGTKLFLRLNKRMVITNAGETLLRSARKVLRELEQTENEIKDIATDKKGSIRLSTECYTCYHWLPPLLKEFKYQHPEIDVEIVVEATRDPIGALLEGKLDLAITSSPDDKDKNIDFKLLFEDEMVVVTHPDHELTKKSFVKPKDFAKEHVINYWSLEESTVYQRILKPAGIAPKRVSQIQLTEAIIEMIKADIGIGVLARWAIESHIKSGIVTAIPLTKSGFIRKWYAATLNKNTTPIYIPDFISLISKSSKPAKMYPKPK